MFSMASKDGELRPIKLIPCREVNFLCKLLLGEPFSFA